MIDWQVGQQLVCIRDFPLAKMRGFKVPEVGDVCTITEVVVDIVGMVVCFFAEIPLQRHPCGRRAGFDAHHFRPVKPTSLDCFQYHLIRAPDLELTK